MADHEQLRSSPRRAAHLSSPQPWRPALSRRPIRPVNTAAVIERGKYLATAADCGACHTAPGGKPFAGGLPIDTPLGTIYSTNITPSADFGIGRYTEEEFSRALRRGIRRRRRPPLSRDALHFLCEVHRRGRACALPVLHAGGKAGRAARAGDRAAVSDEHPRVDDGLEFAVPGLRSLRAGSAAIGRMESGRLSRAGRRPLQHLSHAARLSDAGGGQPRLVGRAGRALVRAQHHVGSDQRHRTAGPRKNSRPICARDICPERRRPPEAWAKRSNTVSSTSRPRTSTPSRLTSRPFRPSTTRPTDASRFAAGKMFSELGDVARTRRHQVRQRCRSQRRGAVSRQLRLLPFGRRSRQQGRLLSEPVPRTRPPARRTRPT